MALEKEWKKYPVFHIDVSMAKGKPDEGGIAKGIVAAIGPFG